MKGSTALWLSCFIAGLGWLCYFTWPLTYEVFEFIIKIPNWIYNNFAEYSLYSCFFILIGSGITNGENDITLYIGIIIMLLSPITWAILLLMSSTLLLIKIIKYITEWADENLTI